MQHIVTNLKLPQRKHTPREKRKRRYLRNRPNAAPNGHESEGRVGKEEEGQFDEHSV